MTPEQIAALVASVPSIGALVWMIYRLQSQNDTLLQQIVATNKLLLDLHPPQSIEGAKLLTKNPEKTTAG